MKDKFSKKGLIFIEIFASVLLLLLFVFPIFSLAGRNEIYVDANANGKEDGSAKYPFHSISDALDEADKGDKVFVAKGTYRENIEIPKDVDLFGEDMEETIIDAKNENQPTVRMDKDKTEINKFTIRGGHYGIKVGSHDRVSIIECIIENNSKDGVKIDEGSTSDKEKVSIVNSKIRENGRAGIYAPERRVIIIDSNIYNNEGDGIVLDKGSRAWVEGNKIADNEGSGMKIILDSSYIWTKNNTIKDNDREGIEINTYGRDGRVDISKSKFYDNGRWGVARVQRGESNWNGFTMDDRNIFHENDFGPISSIIGIW